ncbi:MAG TPA: hypothetical protein VFO46_21775 [Candidatus Sulfotelmatobacter sp.]|nr:hypothetical protein [Candidatus Sulfotelmatobacter sp.]
MSSKPAACLLMAIFLTSTLCVFSTAQDNSSVKQEPSAPPPTPRPEAPIPQNSNSAIKSEEERKIERQEQSQRILGVLPQFGVTSRQNAPPLTSGDKFHLFARSAFDPVSIVVVGLQAGLSQAQDEFPAYGQGAQGYGKRFGASLADEVSSGFWSNYFYPVLLKEDPRYFRLGEGGFGARLAYSVKQEFVCHTDKGGRFFNLSNVLGAFTSGAISNVYYPGRSLIRTIPATATTPAVPVYENDRGAVLTLSRASIALGYGTIGGIFDEFWPDIHHRLFEMHKTPPEVPSNR